MMAIHDPTTASSFWHMIGMAARIAISLNLHRRDSIYLPSIRMLYADDAALRVHNEKRKAVFWSVYCTDRLAMFTLTRPPTIRDSDIDVDVRQSNQPR